MNNYCIYARKATDDSRGQTNSIANQVEILKKYADNKEYIVKDVFQESGSASAATRPVFEDMIAKVKKGEIQGIICVGLDRLSRNFKTAHLLIQLIEQKGLDIITPSKSFNNNLEDKFILSILSTVADYERKIRSELIKRGIKAAKQRKANSI